MTNYDRETLGKNPEVEGLKIRIIEHVRNMFVPVSTNFVDAKCVDGGYRSTQEVGKMAIPGGHLGVSMTLLKVGYTPLEAFNFVKDFVVDRGGKYEWHSDTHAEPVGHEHNEQEHAEHQHHDRPVVGCGHCNAAIKQAHHYGLRSEDVSELLDLIRADQENMNLVVLRREHKERAILVVTSEDYTVKPWNVAEDNLDSDKEEQEDQYFIYDIVRHKNFLAELAADLARKGRNKIGEREVSLADLWPASEAQTNATLGLLGSSKGKPMFSVVAGSELPTVELYGYAPVIEE